MFSISILACIDTTNKKRSKLISIADSFLGAQYDAHNKAGFDCSGFTQYCYKRIHINIPRSSERQAIFSSNINIEKANYGDLLIFAGSNKRIRKPGHVGILHHVSNDTVYFIHASSSSGVIINHLQQPYYKDRYLGVLDLISHHEANN